MEIYTRTQFGTAIAIPLAVALVIVSSFGFIYPVSLLISSLLLLSLLLFYRLAVRVDSEAVSIRFGIGLVRKTFNLCFLLV
ncbi:TPA: hypothetical protein HA361_02365 [Candidatus Woesearchaeota archaeon]|nr:hypothetical protein [Candidatus Woesearchaeota archaeon]